MIEANELRIGNCVYVDEGLTPKEKSVISRISNTWVCVEGADDIYSLDIIDPIPLTVDVLSKAGFTKSYDEIFELTFYDLGDVGICYLEGEFTLSGQKMPPIKYVHQMQNLLFILRGEEITINL